MIKQKTSDPIPADAKKVVSIGETTYVYFADDPEVIEDEKQRMGIDALVVRHNAKQERALRVNNILVTTQAGNTFDGDETSQQRMARAILVMDDIETINWVLADNSVIMASKAELTEALKLAGQAQADMWVIK